MTAYGVPKDATTEIPSVGSNHIFNNGNEEQHNGAYIPRSVLRGHRSSLPLKNIDEFDGIWNANLRKLGNKIVVDRSVMKIVYKSFCQKNAVWDEEHYPSDLLVSILLMADSLGDWPLGRQFQEYLIREFCWKSSFFLFDLPDLSFHEAWGCLMNPIRQVDKHGLLVHSMIKDLSIILELVCRSFGAEESLESIIWELIIGTIMIRKLRSKLSGTNSIIIVSCFMFAVLRLKSVQVSFRRLMEIFKSLGFSDRLIKESFIKMGGDDASLNIVSYYNGTFLPNFKRGILAKWNKNSPPTHRLLKIRATSGRILRPTPGISITSSFKRRIVEF